jgi:hypothetical protein
MNIAQRRRKFMHTTLILGAGFSKPYGFPLGNELRNIIIKSIQGSNFWRTVLEENGVTPDEIIVFRNALIDSQTFSVDQFLNECRQREDNNRIQDIARLVITMVINSYEDIDGLRKNYANDPGCYQSLIRYILGLKGEDKSLSIITFNYDKSFEHALFLAYYANTNSKSLSKDLVMKIPFFHLHGDLGTLDWENSDGREYRVESNPDKIKKMSKRLTTSYNEILLDKKTLGQMERMLQTSDQILFLGFGYFSNNLMQLNFHEFEGPGKTSPNPFWGGTTPINAKNKQIFGSSIGINDKEFIVDLRTKWNIWIDAPEKSASSVLQKYLYSKK